MSLDDGYNVVRALNAFKNALRNDGVSVDLAKFIVAYKELVKFFDKLGKMFSFVAYDLVDKFQNIEKLQQKDDEMNYVTVESAINYEKEKNIHMVNHNATLSLLRLIRGLDFIRKFLETFYENIESHKKTHELAVQVYDQTLAFRHKWSVRQLVKAGLYLLPKKQDLVTVMLHGADEKSTTTHKDNHSLMKDFMSTIDKVYSIIHKIYDENDFLELVLT